MSHFKPNLLATELKRKLTTATIEGIGDLFFLCHYSISTSSLYNNSTFKGILDIFHGGTINHEKVYQFSVKKISN